MLPVFRTLEKVLDSDTTVLIEGESGTGKDALAQWLHTNSSRKHAPFIKLDLGSLPEELVESELFGYERGAFTGAQEAKLGKFDLAQGGTIAIDEIANVDMRVQAKLLHVVEAKQFFRLGGAKPVTLDSRIVVLSSTSLASAVERKTFRQDLFFRLNLINVRVPSLRERRNEVLVLADRLLEQLNRKHGSTVTIAPECHAIFQNYDFPGNVRELRNGLERALLMSSTGRVTPGVLPPNWLVARGGGKLPSLEDIEREYIAQVLNQTRGKKTKAAEVLGISRKTLLEKRKKYGLE
jgi:two-component system response regulator AtoC